MFALLELFELALAVEVTELVFPEVPVVLEFVGGVDNVVINRIESQP